MTRELPVDFVTFAITAGFVAANRWSESANDCFKRSWQKIVNQKKAGRIVMPQIFSLVHRMNKEDDAFLKRSKFEGVSRLESVHEQSIRILVLYPQISEGTTKAPKKPKTRFVQIGFGLASTYKPRSVGRLIVKIDEHTKPQVKGSRSIVYVPGWSSIGTFDDDTA